MSGAAGERGSTKRNEFGAFGGVFTPCLLTILGVIMFMRANFVVGQAGIGGAVLILLAAKSISLLTALSTSAIGTNMQVRGGGAYYLISRVLGPEFGGAIGIVLFVAQAVSVPFYILGFTEAVVRSLPILAPHHALVVYTTASVLFVVTYVGAGWAIRVQYVIMGVLAASILVFMGGAALHFRPSIFVENWASDYTAHPLGDRYSFWMVFAIYFPAVTGIMAGINMSGDLKDPAKSIPRGTLAAIGVAFVVYLLQILVSGGAFSRTTLIERPYLALADNALFGLSPLVAAGMFAATLSSALGSYMGAPRVLQAVSRDGILGFLRPFAKGSVKGDEPRRALIVTGAVTFAVLTWAENAEGGQALDMVAGTITEFFLYTYGMLNVAAFIEAGSGNPSFRPRFRFFHWTTALAGGVGCVVVAFIINPFQAVIAFVFLAGVTWHIKRRDLRAAFGDARWGFLYKAVRDNLIRLASMQETPKNWRPTALVFTGNPKSRETLVNYAVWMEAGRGIAFLANVLVGSLKTHGPYRETAVSQLRDFCEKGNMHAFPIAVVDDSLEHGVSSLLQATQVGPIRPNLAIFGWSEDPEHVTMWVRQLRLARSLGMGVVVIKEGLRRLPSGGKQIDVWWRGMKNGGLMLLLAHLLTRNWEWSDTDVRLLREVGKEEACEATREDLARLVHDARVEATVNVVVSRASFAEALVSESSGADCVFLGFEPPEEGRELEWYERYREMVCEAPTTVLVCAVGDEGLMA